MANNLYARLRLDDAEYNRKLYQAIRNTENFAKKQEAAGRSLNKSMSNIMGVAGKLNSIMGMAFGVSVTSAMAMVVQKNMEFEKSLSSLRALTGMAASDIKELARTAIELGGTTMQTASQVAKAFTIIGSQSPELLKSRTALAAVTKDAIILAEAANMTVEESAKALTMAMNQMNAASNESLRYINILAAASQQGSYDVTRLTTAIEKVGGVAGSLGINFVQLVSSIEAIAPRVSDASIAGNALRNIFLTLEKDSNERLRPSVVGLTAALEELSKMNLTATEMTNMFGKENVAVAIALVEAKNDYIGFTQTLDGTSTALDQQRINADNLQGSITAMKSAWEAFILSMGKSTGVLKTVMDYLTGVIKGMQIVAGNNPYEAESKSAIVENQVGMMMMDVDANKAAGMSDGKAYQTAMDDRIDILENFIFKQNTIIQDSEDKLEDLMHRRVMINPLINGWDEVNQVEAAIKEQQDAISRATKAADYYGAALERVLGLEQEWKDKGYYTGENINAGGKNKAVPSPVISAPSFGGGKSAEPQRVAPVLIPLEISFPNMQLTLTELKKRIAELYKEFDVATTDSDRKMLINRIRELEELLSQMQGYSGGDMKMTVPVQLPKIDKKNRGETLDYLSTISSMMGSLGGVTDNATAAWLSYSASIVGGIAAMLPALASVFGLTAALGIAEQSKIPWPLSIVAMAATAAGLAASIASIPKFAEGGIVPGTSFFGDKVIAGLNSGEMVLNNRQQNNLLRMINMGGSPGMSGNVEFRIKGSELQGVLRNYNAKRKL